MRRAAGTAGSGVLGALWRRVAAVLMRVAGAGLALMLAALAVAPVALAHSMRAAYLEVQESAPGSAAAVWKLPVPGRSAWPEVDGCGVDRAPERAEDGASSAYVTRLTIRCPGPLAGREVVFRGLGLAVGDVVVRVLLFDGAVASQVLGPRSPSWRIPERQTWLEAASRYVVLGIEHIFTGTDHLLFVLGLVLLVGATELRRLLETVTAFTLAHSLTLGATALGVLRLNPAAAEACIALSLVLLALDIGRVEGSRGHGARLAFPFGLAHGLGFAAALKEVGLPPGAVVPALFGFNLGVELGQLAFVAALLAAWRCLGAVLERGIDVRGWKTAGAYGIGWMGTWWFLERWVG